MIRSIFSALALLLAMVTTNAAQAAVQDASTLQFEPVIKHTKSGEHTFEYQFHPITGKLLQFKGHRETKKFTYDDADRLVRIESDDGGKLDFSYDDQNNIHTIIEEEPGKGVRRELFFRYNAAKKPIQIELKGVGTLKVTYDSNGEVGEVDSDGGALMAMEITQWFMNMQSMLRLAGRNLKHFPCKKQPVRHECPFRSHGEKDE